MKSIPYVMISAVIILLVFVPVTSFSQNRLSQNHPYKLFSERRLSQFSKFQKRIEKFNNELIVLAEKSDYTYIYLYQAFLDKDGSLKNEYSNDDLHLLGTGYLKWKELIQPSITVLKRKRYL